MSRGAHLKGIKKIIAEIYRRHPGLGPTKIHAKLQKELKRQGLDRNYGPDWPSVSAVGKVMTKINKSPNSYLNEPWSLSSLPENPIPPEVMPVVMSVYKKRLAEKDPLLIREALWIARLYKIVDPPDLVWDWAFLYAIEEMVSEDLGEPFDSRRLDLEMINDVYSAREIQREIAIWGIADEYGADPVELKDLNLSIEETEEIAKSGKYKKEVQKNARICNEAGKE